MNLQKSRVLFAVTAAGFLLLCNLGYLFANSQDRQQAFAAQMDQPPIQMLSLLLLVGVIAFAVIRNPGNGDET